MAQDYLPYLTQNPYAAASRPPDNKQSRGVTSNWMKFSLVETVAKTWGFFTYDRQNFYADMNRYKVLKKQPISEVELDEGQVSLYNTYNLRSKFQT